MDVSITQYVGLIVMYVDDIFCYHRTRSMQSDLYIFQLIQRNVWYIWFRRSYLVA